MDAEKALSLLGNPWTCPWTMTVFLIVSILRGCTTGWNLTGIVFLGALPEHHCRLPPRSAAATPSESPVTSPNTSSNVVAGSCYVYSNVSSGENATKQRCPNGWQYEGEFYSMVNEWDLVCDRDLLADTSQVIFTVGTMIGAVVVGHLTDRFGRKKVMLSSLASVGVLTVSSAWVPEFYMLLPLRFLLGFAVQGMNVSGFVFLMEWFANNQRARASYISMASWGFCMMSLAGLAYFLRNWRHLMSVMALPAVMTIPGIWFCQESIPWLLAHNKVEKAKEVLQCVVNWNGKTLNVQELSNDLLPDKIITEGMGNERRSAISESHKSPPETKDISHLKDSKYHMSSPRLSKKSTEMFGINIGQMFSQSKLDVQQSEHLVKLKDDGSLSTRSSVSSGASTEDETPAVVLICRSATLRRRVFAISLSVYGLSLSSSSLAGNVFINFSLSGLMETPSCIVAGVLSMCLGRKPVLSGSYMTGSLFLGLTVLIPAMTDDDFVDWVIVGCAMISKFLCTMGFSLMPLYLVELFPTTIRSFCIGSVYFVGRLGTALAPMSTYMSRHVWWFSGVTSSSLTMTAGLLLLLLPETNGRRLLQNVREMKENEKQKTPIQKGSSYKI